MQPGLRLDVCGRRVRRLPLSLKRSRELLPYSFILEGEENMNSALSIFVSALEQVEKARKDISHNGLSYEILSHISNYMEVELNSEVFPKSKEEFQKQFTADAIIRLHLWDVYLYMTPDFSRDLSSAGKGPDCHLTTWSFFLFISVKTPIRNNVPSIA